MERTKPIPDFFLLFNSRSASVPLSHLLASPSSSQNIGNPPTDLGRLCTYPQHLPISPKRISCSNISAKVGTVRFVVAVFAQLSLGTGSTNSRGSLSEVVLADSIAVLGTLSTIISLLLTPTRMQGGGHTKFIKPNILRSSHSPSIFTFIDLDRIRDMNCILLEPV